MCFRLNSAWAATKRGDPNQLDNATSKTTKTTTTTTLGTLARGSRSDPV